MHEIAVDRIRFQLNSNAVTRNETREMKNASSFFFASHKFHTFKHTSQREIYRKKITHNTFKKTHLKKHKKKIRLDENPLRNSAIHFEYKRLHQNSTHKISFFRKMFVLLNGRKCIEFCVAFVHVLTNKNMKKNKKKNQNNVLTLKQNTEK